MPPRTPVGLFGAGKSTRKHTWAILDDWAEDKQVSLLLPGSPELFSAPVRYTADWALSRKVGLTLLVSEGQPTDHLEDYDGATLSHTHDILGTLTSTVEHLIIAWDSTDPEVDEEYSRWATSALEKGIKVYDLTEGLDEQHLGTVARITPLILEEEGEEAAEPESSPEPAKGSEELLEDAPPATDLPDTSRQLDQLEGLLNLNPDLVRGTSPSGSTELVGVSEDRITEIVRGEICGALVGVLNYLEEALRGYRALG